MPIHIGSCSPLSNEEFAALKRRQTERASNLAMAELLEVVESASSIRVPLVEGHADDPSNVVLPTSRSVVLSLRGCPHGPA